MKVVLIGFQFLSINEIALRYRKGNLRKGTAALSSSRTSFCRNWHLDLVASFLVVQMSAFSKPTIELTNHPTNKLIQVVEASQGRSLRLSG